MNASEIRELAPAAGLKEYWYPALKARSVRNKPVGLKLLGDDIVFFRGESGAVAALANACPHRGGSLSHGHCHFKGTIACPYHGWVFNEDGECLAVLSEGPDSRIPSIAKVRKYPTRTLKGLVFIWMGDGQPVSIEEDVPPEFFEGDATLVFSVIRQWPVNWRVSLENALDSHVMYVHRDSFLQLSERVAQIGRDGYRPIIVKDKACLGYLAEPPTYGRHYYPKLKAHWPKTEIRCAWTWLFRWRKSWADFPSFNGNPEWDMNVVVDGQRMRSGGHHLPSMFRVPYWTFMYTRVSVPIDENHTKILYYHSVRPRTAPGRLIYKVWFHLFYNWLRHHNFSRQDFRVMQPQRYDLPEMLSRTDAHIVAWRRLLLKARGPNVRQGGGAKRRAADLQISAELD